MGEARLNMTDSKGSNSICEVYEGLQDIEVDSQRVDRLSGNDGDDGSEVPRYVSIRHGGINVLPNREISGLSLGRVARGTVADHVKCHAMRDAGMSSSVARSIRAKALPHSAMKMVSTRTCATGARIRLR